MKKHRFAWLNTIVLTAAFAIAACGGSGGGTPATGNAQQPSASGLTVTITSPNADQIDTTDGTMNLSGTASSDAGVTSVAWTSDKGHAGTASGTDSWTVDQVPLDLGANTIIVTATDGAGDTRSDTIVINRESTGTGSATLSWEAPTQRTDGTALTDLAGYTIHYGRMSGVYDYQIDVNTPGVMTYVIENLVPGDWYFALTAYDSAGLVSDLSNEAHRVIQ
ncbi:MAG TPA: Ig-like domain-containing protein [Woeseiaceae bacterium]|nr:Ig-like domain-containing protein [Woeseiaceae bacterium]